jgi:hypothetical protein
MCGGGGTPSLEQQAQALDTPPEISYFRGGSRPMPGFHRPIPLEVLNAPNPKELSENALQLMLENFNQISFMTAYLNIVGATENPTLHVAQGWAEVQKGIDSASESLQQNLAKWEQETAHDPGAWTGAAKDAAMQNLSSSLNTIATISAEAGKLSNAANAFNNAITNTYSSIVPQYPAYQAAMNSHSTNKNAILYAFNRYAQSVMTNTYSPNMQEAQQPVVFPTATPQVSSPAITGGPTGFAGAPTIGGLTPSGGAPVPVDDPGTSATPNGTDPTIPEDTSQTPTTPQTPAAAQSLTDPSAAAASPTSGMSGSGLSDLGDTGMQGLSGLASPLQSALGQAANAGRGNPGAPGGANGPGKLPPEGQLNGLGKGGGLKGGGGGIGGGAGAHGSAIGRAGAPATAAGRTVAAGARAGLSGTPGVAAGAPGAGAPAAGQQGAGAQGAQHQPNKALRRKRNGEEIIGDAEAVVPVLGEPAKAEAAKPDAT